MRVTRKLADRKLGRMVGDAEDAEDADAEDVAVPQVIAQRRPF